VQPPASPIVVKVMDAPVRGLGLGDVILNAVGLTGALAIGALVLGFVLAALVIGYRKLQARRITDEDAAQTQQLGLTPPAHR
jgi:ABC-type Fe3+ transport system permease subunit